MMEETNVCIHHSGFKTDIKNLKKTQDDQRIVINGIRRGQNWILGGITMGLIMAFINLFISMAYKGTP